MRRGAILILAPRSDVSASIVASRRENGAQLGFRLEQPYLCCLLIATWKRLNSIFRTPSRMTCMIRDTGTHDIDTTPFSTQKYIR